MAKGGRRYPLVVYTHMIDRWWPAISAIGVSLLGVAWLVKWWGFEEWRWLACASVGAVNIFIGLFLILIRKAAYVQPFSDHLRLATPLLRLNISYKRFQRTSSANIGVLFPPNSVTKWQVEIIQPLAKMTAIVITLNAFPMSQSSLRLFLSPLFFKDKTPHFVILVDDWMKLSGEIESMRSGTSDSSAPRQRRDNSILSRLPGKDQ
ncbi:MAG: hypothetical protein IPN96_24285 [Anaerolineales bacterium]|jgi:hypothetical protein|uniref:hypothetical protein n=1 Tax=Candidatus Villigracilis proximus TaxID=3140683 RepID=UPI003136710F|nr:hypothetical protein [Anaerolineales bacterium]MBK8824898.1 hypothetical protein [Anaerolineales bacterium]MBK9211292.1 hypothetical protein [Anaerolineales bacterium]